MADPRKSLKIDWYNQRLRLLPERAVFWEEEKILLAADPHIGKAFAFRSAGIPVPRGTTDDDLRRLSAALQAQRPQTLIILGDLLHDKVADARDLLRRVGNWRRKWSDLTIILVAGNHDRRAGTLPDAFGIDQVVETYTAGPFTFSHRPDTAAAGYLIAGHIHPAVRLRGPGRQREVLPCFHFGPDSALLPAFGSFTGNHILQPEKRDRVFVVAEDEVIEVINTR